MRRSFYVLLFSLIVATAVCVFMNADITMARLFYQPGAGFPIGKLQPWKFLYDFGVYPAYTMGTIALLIVIAGYFRASLISIRRQALFIAILLIIGPGILVNSIFKDHWGRPRPVHVDIFGGKLSFHQPWLPGPASRNASFPAGHPSAAFYMSAPYFVMREKKQRRKALLWLWGGILYGVVMGIARVIQGGHFVTDVIWSAGFVYLTAMVLAALMFPNPDPQIKDP
ncbi:MAG: phosphatase PAP2 family protein [Geobacteraceae bacterium]|nr:phosphatase PAP2 family protein [Geobacteraceae bacterium]